MDSSITCKEREKNELSLSQLFNYNMKMQLIFYNSSHFSHQYRDVLQMMAGKQTLRKNYLRS